MDEQAKILWDRCVRFHGHDCGGLAVGFQAARYAAELLEITRRSEDEQIVCITENSACGVDAIQELLGCTAGKGNLIFNIHGKNAFSFFNRENGKSCRLMLRYTPKLDREQRLAWLKDGDYHEMFDVSEPPDPIPEPAKIFKNCTCSICGERMAENHAHMQEGEIVCDRCFIPYSRGF